MENGDASVKIRILRKLQLGYYFKSANRLAGKCVAPQIRLVHFIFIVYHYAEPNSAMIFRDASIRRHDDFAMSFIVIHFCNDFWVFD